MISRCYIIRILGDLERAYIKTRSLKKSLYYSKLALMELCGWIEESMDDVILRCAKRKIKNSVNYNYTLKQIVRRNHGFTYGENFRKMIIQLSGIIATEKIESLVDPAKDAGLKSQLDTLKRLRDPEAHTHLKGLTRTIDSPSVTLARFPFIYDGLKEYEKIIKEVVG